MSILLLTNLDMPKYMQHITYLTFKIKINKAMLPSFPPIPHLSTSKLQDAYNMFCYLVNVELLY